MKGIRLMMIAAGIAALLLIFLAVNAMMQTIRVQRERPLKKEVRQEQPSQQDAVESRRYRR